MYLQQYFIDGLGCVSYLIGCESAGVAAAIDPDRDVRKYVDTADAHGLKITHIIETRLHADHVSGNSDLAVLTGATIYVHPAANAAFEHHPLNDGDVITLGTVELQVQHTPEHTPESITLLVIDKPRAIEQQLVFGDRQAVHQDRIREINRKGPNILGEIRRRGLNIQNALADLQRGAALLDLRSKADYKTRHIPGSIHLAADDQLSTHAAFALPPDIPIVLLLADPDDYQRVVYSLARVGFDDVIGYLADSLQLWEAMRLPVTSGDVHDITAAQLHDMLQKVDANTPMVIDVREPSEQASGHIPGAKLIPLGEFARQTKDFDLTRPVAVICASGSRSQSAASMLSQKGAETVYNVLGGTLGWMQQGFPLERG